MTNTIRHASKRPAGRSPVTPPRFFAAHTREKDEDHQIECLYLRDGECDCGFHDHLDQADEAGVSFVKALRDWRRADLR